jgi:predicted dehydrogenase
METYGVGIVGTGWVAKQHCEAFENHPGTRVMGLASSSLESAEASRAAWGLDCQVYPDYASMLENPHIRIVSIATPNHLHPEQTILAAQAGKHILIEKPPALNLQDLKNMQNAVRLAKVKTVVSYVLRWNPLIQTMKSYIHQGALGRIFFAQVDYWNNSGRAKIPGHWTTRRRTGGSAFLTGGNHAVDAIRWLVEDEIIEVSALGTMVGQDYEYIPNVLAWVKFKNGAIGKVSAVLEGQLPYQFNIDLLGERGSFRDNRLWSPKMFAGQNDWIDIPTITPSSGDVTHHPFRDEVAHFVQCIQDDQESYVNLDDAVKTIEACIAIDHSLASGAPVKLPLEDQALPDEDLQ